MEEPECCICFEISKQNEKIPSRLKNQDIFLKTCNCDLWIHQNCLEMWYTRHETCPICRTYMMQTITLEYQYGIYMMYYIYIKCLFVYQCTRAIHLGKIFVFFTFLTNIMNLVSIFYKKEYVYSIEYNYTEPQIL
jgi:hypothetical protein